MTFGGEARLAKVDKVVHVKLATKFHASVEDLCGCGCGVWGAPHQTKDDRLVMMAMIIQTIQGMDIPDPDDPSRGRIFRPRRCFGGNGQRVREYSCKEY